MREDFSPSDHQVPAKIRLKPGEHIVGRAAEASVQLAHPEVSRKHCRISVAHRQRLVEVEDLGSRTGTLINGQRFDRTELLAGDRLRIGPFNYRFDGLELHLEGDGAGVIFENVCVVAGGRLILDGVTFEIPPRAFTGILGPSGAGKSTLIKCAAGLLNPTEGRIELRSALSGYVPQDDIVHSRLTPRQALFFAARLRLRRGLDSKMLERIVSKTLALLQLEERADVRIDRLSGGQRKRVSVAVELLARPAILFLDEPTSGLDPAAEMRLMELLRRLATSGCTVVCTTHIVENVYLMEQLVVLSRGRLAFVGSPDETRSCFGITRFQELYERLHTSAELDVAAAPPQKEQPVARIPETAFAGRAPLATPLQSRRGALPILLARMFALLCAEPRQVLLLALQPVLIGLLLGLASNDPALILFFCGISALWFGCNNSAEEIISEEAIFRREYHAGVSRTAYAASKILWMSALTLVQTSLLYSTCQLLEGGLAGDWRWQLLALGLAATMGSVIGLAISALARTPRQAILAVPLFLIPQIVLSGFTIPAHEMEHAVRRVAKLLPSYAIQQLNDVGFVWNKPLSRDVLKEHYTSFRNLNESGTLKTGDLFRNTQAIRWSLTIQAAWWGIAVALLWCGLRKGE